MEQGKRLGTLDLKEQLSFLDIPEQGRVLTDLAIGAYLVNPLKSTYYYDDIAKEYLGLLLPSAQEILGKGGFSGAQPEKAARCGGYMAYVAWKAQKPLLEKLADMGMEELYWEVEMPLVYTLYDMEQAGIAVNAKELKTYGEQLGVRIQELEEQIYQEAGKPSTSIPLSSLASSSLIK